MECHGILSDEDICASVQQGTGPQPESDEEAGEDPLPPQKPRDAIQALCTVRVFIEQQEGDCNTLYNVENQVHMLIANKAKQGSISSFYQGLFLKCYVYNFISHLACSYIYLTILVIVSILFYISDHV